MSPALFQKSAAEARALEGNRSSFAELAQQFDVVVREKRDAVRRLNQALAEIEGINELYQQRRLEFDAEKRRLNSEIEKLQAQVVESSKKDDTITSAGIQALLRTRERLTREEFEKKFQELAAEVRRQRKKYVEQVDEMKSQISGCICKVSKLR